MKQSALALAALVVLPLPSVLAQQTPPPATVPPVNLALNKKYVSSDPNPSGWSDGLTDGSWDPNRTRTFATGGSAAFPKTVTIDLETAVSIGYIGVGVPAFGSTKTIAVALSSDGTAFTEVGNYVFSQKKEEKHLFTFTPVTARYVRLTYPDFYSEQVNFPSTFAFTTEVTAYAPGPAPVLPPTYAPLPFQPADVPAPKLSPDASINPAFLQMHQSFLKRAKEGPIDLLFVGDSITQGWRNSSPLWNARYGKYNAANFGISGDRTQHVLWRFENGELDGINPKVVVVMIGTNNIGYPADDIIKADQKIVAEIHRRLPNSKVLLLGIFPRGASGTDKVREKIKGINAELAKLDDGNKTRYLDIGDKFLDANGNITKEIMPDALHPSGAGYQIWADAMQPLLDEMMQ